MRRTRVLVADDHDAMLRRIVRLLEPNFDVVGTAVPLTLIPQNNCYFCQSHVVVSDGN